ncbi:oxidoreductase [Pseudomonas azotoformans]
MSSYWNTSAVTCRATGVIFREATGISQHRLGVTYAPGIWYEEHMNGWRKVTEAVHNEGCKIVLQLWQLWQLWQLGRGVHSSFNQGHRPVASLLVSADEAKGSGEIP